MTPFPRIVALPALPALAASLSCAPAPPPTGPPAPGGRRRLQGQCEADNATFGCHAEIRNGRITDPICVD